MKENLSQQLVINSNDNLMVIASAGCGKTYCIVNKIKRLSSIPPENILVISFTNETVNDLKKKLPSDVHVMTFHKLAMYILKDKNYDLSSDDLLDYIIDDFFTNKITKKEISYLKFYFFDFSYNNILKSNVFLKYKNTIKTFINLLKTNNYENEFLNKVYKTEKDKFLISIILKINYLYKKEKTDANTIDLDDLIVEATIKANKSKFKYQYIFVDEFQDTSQIRFNLIYEIFKNSNSTINFFGDDFQSIYSFSGCNLQIMLDIKSKIKDIKIVELNINYRSDNHLIKTANDFIMKNDKQLKKTIKSDLTIKDSINYIYYNNYKKCILNYLKKFNKEDIMILGRYKSDFSFIDNSYRKLTIHESKGLEAKYVFILNFKNEEYGFPSKVKDEKIIHYFNNIDSYPYSEERRIFYVAITRAKEKVFLFIPKKNKSIFINEFKLIDKKNKKN